MKQEIRKTAEKEMRLVWGEVYAPNRPDVHGEFMDAEAIQSMAHDFMRKMKLDRVDTRHDNELTPGVVVVESFIAREGDPDFIPGSWVVGVHVNDDAIWEQIKKGELNGFSVEALVVKQTSEVEVDVPDVIRGTTTEADGHTHHFEVTFAPDGTFRGGATDMVEGHSHRIVGGTVTEISKQHRHRFSAVDDVLVFETEAAPV